MTLKETLKQLEALGNEKVRAQNAKSGAGDDQFGVSLGDIRVLAKKIRTDHPLALSLWETGNVDAQFLATLLIEPKKLSADDMDRIVPDGTSPRSASERVRMGSLSPRCWIASSPKWPAPFRKCNGR